MAKVGVSTTWMRLAWIASAFNAGSCFIAVALFRAERRLGRYVHESWATVVMPLRLSFFRSFSLNVVSRLRSSFSMAI